VVNDGGLPPIGELPRDDVPGLNPQAGEVPGEASHEHVHLPERELAVSVDDGRAVGRVHRDAFEPVGEGLGAPIPPAAVLPTKLTPVHGDCSLVHHGVPPALT
jgi:hypothetical protein